MAYLNNNNIPLWYDGTTFRMSDGTLFNSNKYGTFSQKPSSLNISVGYAYFCTDKQTSESSTNGIMIYHKGNDIWVDALGRVIS